MTQGVITSLPPLIQQPPGNASANPAGLPGVTYIAAVPILPQTWTGLQTFLPGTLELSGVTSGNTFLNASAVASGTVRLPAITGVDTLLANANIAVVTNKSLDGLTNTFTNLPASSLGSTTGTGAVVLSTSPVITTPTGIGKADVGLSNVANVDTTNAANISSGTLPAARLPNPSASTLGGVQSAAAVSHQWINSVSTSGVPALSQPAFTDISGSVAATQLPNPSATTLGGIESLAAVGSKWINTISTSGVPSATQPAFTDISGSVSATQMPALTGDVTTSAGAVATTIAANAVTNAKMATMAAWTFKANNTGSAATPTDITIDGLTVKASPVAGDEMIIWDVAGAALKKATVSSIGSAGSVSSIAGNTGAFTLSTGITNSTNDIRLTVPVAVANGGTGYIGGAWTTWSPTITSGSGTPTTVTFAGTFLQIGKLIHYIGDVTITTVGTAAGTINLTLPVGTSVRRAVGTCAELALTGTAGTCQLGVAGTVMSLLTYNNLTFWASGARVTLSGIYEAT